MVTTLLDAKRYTAWQLTQLYGLRWQAAEVNLRHLKTTLKMEMLTAKTPAMVRKEIWTHLFAYTPHANSDVEGNWNLRLHTFSTLTPSRKTAVQSNGPATGNDGKIHSEAIVSSSAGASCNRLVACSPSSL